MGRRAANRDPRIAELIEEAIVDAYTEDEQHWSFLTMLDEHIPCPVTALVVGEVVEVLGFDRESEREIVAKVRRSGRSYDVNATALEWDGPRPPGAEWLDAYRAWLAGGW